MQLVEYHNGVESPLILGRPAPSAESQGEGSFSSGSSSLPGPKRGTMRPQPERPAPGVTAQRAAGRWGDRTRELELALCLPLSLPLPLSLSLSPNRPNREPPTVTLIQKVVQLSQRIKSLLLCILLQ